jgi:DNA mismatch repair ATPase MutS
MNKFLQVALTFVTTHHAELKEEADQNPDFVNASVRFDIKTCLPTFVLVWDSLGASNALSVAQALGFDRNVVQAGHSWKLKLAKHRDAQINSQQMVAALQVCTILAKYHTNHMNAKQMLAALQMCAALIRGYDCVRYEQNPYKKPLSKTTGI